MRALTSFWTRFSINAHLADTFKKADPALANAALQALDERLDEFANEIDPMGWDQEWYEIGGQLFRRAPIGRLDSLPRVQTRTRGSLLQGLITVFRTSAIDTPQTPLRGALARIVR